MTPARSRITLLALSAALLAPVAPAGAAPVQADLDRDGVFDDLEAGLRHVPASRDVRVIVRLGADATRTRVAALERDVDSLDASERFDVVDAFAAVVDAGDVRELAAEPAVLQVERDAPVRAFNASAQESFGVGEARLDLATLDGDADGNAGAYSPDDLVAAVIDTGIDAAHADLDGGKVLAFQDFTEATFDAALDASYDDNGHGSHVAGTIAGDGDGGGDGRGVAPRAALVGLKVLDSGGSGWTSDVIAAIEWVTTNKATYGIEAINLSLGSSGCSDGSDSESAAVNAAHAAGIVTAVAAGNSGPAPCSVGAPGGAAGALTVGAMADLAQSGFYLAGFSSRGPTPDGRTKPDVVAPGVSVSSAKANSSNGYATYSGTSMATPFVAGVSLLMRDLNPLLTAAQIKQKIMDTAIDWGAPGAENDYGAGRLDAYAAIAAATTPVHLLLTSPPASLPAYQNVQASLNATGAKRYFTITPSSASAPLTLGLTVANASSDFDMYLYDSTNDVVARALTPHRQDELHLSSAPSGPYTLHVESYAGSGAFYLDVSGGAAVEIAGGVTPPVNDAAPTVAGTAMSENVLAGSAGSWSGSGPISYGYSWDRCGADGTGCSATGDTDTSYTLAAADVGKRLRFTVTAVNSGGSVSASSALTDVIAPAEMAPAPIPDELPPVASDEPPVGETIPTPAPAATPPASAPVSTAPAATAVRPRALTAPGLRGSAGAGARLTASAGRWLGTRPLRLSVQWLRCAASGRRCAPIAGATGSRYQPTGDDLGHRLRARVTARNSAGRAQRTSRATSLVRRVPTS